MTTIIQVDYEGLERVAQILRRQSDLVGELRRRVSQAAQPLIDGGWQGRGSAAFATETQIALAAVDRLEQVLEFAGGLVAGEIPHLYRTAEEEAAAPFKGSFTGSDAVAAAAGSTAAGDSGETGSGLLGAAADLVSDTLGAAGAAVLDIFSRVGSGIGAVVENTFRSPDLPPDLYLGPNASAADLFRVNANQYDAPFGQVEQAVRVFTDDNGQYLISIMGTDNDHPLSKAWWDSNLFSGQGKESPYSRQVSEYIKNLNLPPGATIHLVGHSQGGHVANILSHDPELVERYNIGSIITYGSSSNTTYNPKVGEDKYHNFISTDDKMMTYLDGAAKSVQQKLDPEGTRGKFIQNRFLEHDHGGHGGYGDISQLEDMELPFKMNSFRQVSAYAPQHHVADFVWSGPAARNTVEQIGSTFVDGFMRRN